MPVLAIWRLSVAVRGVVSRQQGSPEYMRAHNYRLRRAKVSAQREEGREGNERTKRPRQVRSGILRRMGRSLAQMH